MLVPKNLGQTRLPTYPRTTTSKPPGLVSGSEGTRRGRITEKKSEPYECHIQQNKQNHSIRAGSRGLRVWPRAWVWWPPAWAGLLASPPRPRLPRTVPKAPSAPALLAEASTSNAALADILVFYGVFIFSFMVQLTIAQLLFESCPKMHKHQQERSAVNDRGTAPGASGGVGGGAVPPPPFIPLVPPIANPGGLGTLTPSLILSAEHKTLSSRGFWGTQHGSPQSPC